MSFALKKGIQQQSDLRSFGCAVRSSANDLVQDDNFLGFG